MKFILAFILLSIISCGGNSNNSSNLNNDQSSTTINYKNVPENLNLLQ